MQNVAALHSVSASPPGGTYNETQSVTLESTEPSATIFYTTDGNDPTTNSTQYNGTAISITTNSTLKFIAVDVAGNHTSVTVTESYMIDTSPPTASASPPGGTYNETQSVTLESTEPSATIFYTTDGNDPTTNSTQYNGTAISITTNSTLKFIAVDVAGNPSIIQAELYDIELPAPTVINVEPEDGATRINVLSIINATFSRPMDENSISTDTFLLVDQFGLQAFGDVAYDVLTDTAIFTPDPFSPLQPGMEYSATLTEDITDIAGNPIQTSSWNFTTGGQIFIALNDVETSTSIPGSAFTITPNPFTLAGSLEVEDNGAFDSDFALFGSSIDGFIIVNEVDNAFTTYLISETVVPQGYSKIYSDAIVTVVEVDACGDVVCSGISSVILENINATSSISDVGRPVVVPPPYLSESQFELYKDDVIIGLFSGVANSSLLPTLGPIEIPHSSSLPFGSIVTSESLHEVLPDSVNFPFTAPASSTGPELFENYKIPVYPGLVEHLIEEDIVYVVPPIVIPYEDSKDNFILTPVIDKVSPGLTLSMEQLSFVESKVARFEKVKMTFNVNADDVGFSFGITNTPPPGTTAPPLDAQALFLDVGFVGDVDFSDPESFESPPRIDILVNKTLSGFDELPDGCIDFVMLMFDEDDEEWREVQKLRNPTLDSGAETPNDPTDDKCGFTLEPPHFSKFAVGGIKGSIVAAEAILVTGGGGGGGRDGNSATSIQQMVSGEEVAVTTDVGSESVTSLFEFVAPGSGQLKIESDPVTKFEKLFDEMADVQQQETEKQGILHLNDATYSTVGTVFDIDSSDVNFSGTFNVTIPYKEDIVLLSLGSESDVRLLHYNSELEQWEDITIGGDEKANTVTGRMMNSSSPVVAALIVGDTPVEKIGISSTALSNSNLNSQPWQVSSREQVTLSVTMNNIEELSSSNDQSIMFILQTLDEDGVVVDITFQTVMLETAMSGELAESWVEDDPGMYRIEILIWSSLDKPASLSDAAFTPMIKVIQ